MTPVLNKGAFCQTDWCLSVVTWSWDMKTVHLTFWQKNLNFLVKNVFNEMGHFCVQEHKKGTVLDKKTKVQKCILTFILV